MPWESTAPDVIDALVALFKTADGVNDVDVVDGPVVSGSARREAVMVGWRDDDLGVDAIETDSERGTFTTDPMLERYTVNNAIRVRHGGRDIPAARRRLFTIRSAVMAVLLADVTLGGLVLSVYPGPWSLTQQPQNGAEALLIFALEVDAYTR